MTMDYTDDSNCGFGQEYLYDAFISYRHRPSDTKIAVAIMELLEKHKGLNGKKLHVFRDLDELPTSSNLGGDIHRALEQSRFLIAVCSPDYCESRWCLEEIRYFRKLHGNTNTNILTILVSGEPFSAFPNELFHEQRYDPKYGMTEIDIEPLGADIRGENDRQRLKKLKSTEIYRLLAPIIGLSYDGLYNREARRRNRRRMILTTGVAAAALAFGIYSNAMLVRIIQSRRDMYAAEALRLANESMQLMNQDPSMALLLAQSANRDEKESTPVPLAGTALRSAVAQLKLDQSEYIRVNAVLPLGSSRSWELYDFIHHGKCFAVQQNGVTYVYDSWNGSLLKEINHGEVLFSKDDKSYLYLDKVNDHQFRYTLCDFETDKVIASNVEDVPCDDKYNVVPPSGIAVEDGGFVFGWGNFIEMNCVSKVSAAGEWEPHETVSEEIQQLLCDYCFYMAKNPLYQIGNYAQVPDISYQPQLSEDDRSLEENAKNSMEERSSSKVELNEVQFSYTPDDALMMCYGSFISWERKGLFQTYQTDIYERKNGQLVYSVEGVVYPGGLDNTLLVIRNGDIQLLSYRPELFIYQLNECNSFTHLSPDGRLAAMTKTVYENMELKTVFSLVRTDATNQPVVERTFNNGHCYVSDDLQKAVVLADGTLELWNASGTLLKQWNDFGGEFIISSDGSVLVLLEDTAAEIWSTDSLQQIGRVELESMEVPRAAVQGNMLVVWNYGSMDLYDIQQGKMTASIATDEFYYCDLQNQLRLFTKDGLILLNSPDVNQGSSELLMIYDTQKGKTVPFYTTKNAYAANTGCVYDEQTGTLFVQCGDRIFAEQRNQEDAFEPVYTIISQENDMSIQPAAGALQNGFLILNNGSATEVYRISDGSLYCRICANNRYNSMFGLTENGKMVDLRCYGNQLGEISLSDLENTEASIADSMTSPLSVRALGQKEQDRYFIPEEWMPPNGGNKG